MKSMRKVKEERKKKLKSLIKSEIIFSRDTRIQKKRGFFLHSSSSFEMVGWFALKVEVPLGKKVHSSCREVSIHIFLS
jgi:hypothetical protein